MTATEKAALFPAADVKMVSNAEETFLRAKVKEIGSQYDIIFIPTIAYEYFVLAKVQELIKQIPGFEGLIKRLPDEDKILEPIVEPFWENLGNTILDLIENKAGKSAAVVRQEVFACYIDIHEKGIKFSKDDIVINAPIKEIFFAVNEGLASCFLEYLAHVEKSAQAIKKQLLSLPLHVKLATGYYHERHNEQEIPLNERLESLFDIIWGLEFEAKKHNYAPLFRGMRACGEYFPLAKEMRQPWAEVYSQTNVLQQYFLDSPIKRRCAEDWAAIRMGKRCTGFLGRGEVHPETKQPCHDTVMNSLCYGSSMLAGIVNDISASAMNGFDGSNCGYVFFLDKNRFVDGVLGEIFFIPPVSTLVGLFAAGELFHPRTKVYDVAKGLVCIHSLEIERRCFVDRSGLFYNIGDPLLWSIKVSIAVNDDRYIRAISRVDEKSPFKLLTGLSFDRAKFSTDFYRKLWGLIAWKNLLKRQRAARPASSKDEKGVAKVVVAVETVAQ